MGKRLLGICLCMVCVFFPNVQGFAVTPAEVLQFINEKNRELDAPESGLKQYRYDFENGKPLFTWEDALLLKDFQEENPQIKQVLTEQEAIEEAEWIFRLLRSQYGLYTWFGGDTVFEMAEASILDSLRGTGAISVKAYRNLLVGNLSFINDSHFMLGYVSFAPSLTLFGNEDREFYAIEGSFYDAPENGRKILEIENMPPEKYIKLAINKQGSLSYYLYAMEKTADEIKVRLVYDTQEEETVILRPAKYKEEIEETEPVFESRVENGVFYLKIDSFLLESSTQWMLTAFVDSAKEMAGYPAAVFDISKNTGGDGRIPFFWFRNYTSRELRPNYSELRVAPKESWQLYWGELLLQYQQSLVDMGLFPDGYYYVYQPEKQFIEQEGPVIFLLTTRDTASSGELFTDTLKNLANVVTIGTNTGGVMTNGSNYLFALPYSGLPLQFGECLYYWDKDYFTEGYGIEPDIYLTGDNREERLHTFLAWFLEN